MNILLTGPTGFVGARVLEDLHSAGHNVTALAHSRSAVAEIVRAAPGSTTVFGDVSDPFEMRGIVPEGTEAIIYLPGLLREDPRRRLTFQRVHVEGVRNLLEEAKRAGVRRWIHMSALGTRANAPTKYFSTKWQAEELVRASSLDWTIMRPSYIFDDRPTKRMNFVSELANVVRSSPLVPVPGDGSYRAQPVALDDVSQTFVQSLAMDTTIGKTYSIGGPDVLSYNAMVRAIAQALGLKRTLVHIPIGIMAALAETLGRFPFFPITGEQLVMLTEENFVRDPADLVTWQSAFRLTHKPFEESVQRMLA
jgi:NADH dehydrogenase